MDKKFCLFDNWLKQKNKMWADMGITVTQTIHIPKATNISYHSYTIELNSKSGDGIIKLYESNDIYWVDIEGCNYDKEDIFCLCGIDFENIESISTQINEFELFML